MLARVLYADQRRALELNWLGLGALQCRHRAGAIRRAHRFQKRYFLLVVDGFAATGEPVHPSNPRCSALMRDFCDLLDKPPDSLIWRTMLEQDPREVGRGYAVDG